MITFKEDVLTDHRQRVVVEWITNNENLDTFNSTTESSDTSREAFACTFKRKDLPETLDFFRDTKTNIYNIIGIITYQSGDIPEHVDDDLVWYMRDCKIPEIYIKPPNTTCVYYASIPEEMTGGDTIFKCKNTITAPAVDNSMVEFPSNIPHSVSAMSAERPRVVLVCEKYKLLRPALQYLKTPIYREG